MIPLGKSRDRLHRCRSRRHASVMRWTVSRGSSCSARPSYPPSTSRGGEVTERLAEVSVTVHRVDLVGYQPPLVSFRLVVSAGTYVRAVARDLGERLGVGAHLTSLRREAIGALRVEN